MDTGNVNLLSSIYNPDDLKKLDIDELPQLCREIREFMVEELSHNPGHLASSLGAVELTVALHYVFDTPYDRIVWDVGHQAYVHKILTERRERFGTLRKFGGLSGFPSPAESNYDAFISGHASNSISAALGMSVAANLKKENRKVVAVIGDGAMSGGLAFEGLNNAAESPNDLLIILNDNDMAIDHNVGSLNRYLVHITTSPHYNKLRYKLYNYMRRHNMISEEHRGLILRLGNSIKSIVSRQQNIFEGLNIRYFGPIDGHDITYMVRVLRDIKNMKGPKLLHLRTLKGKGYKPAEDDAIVWHAPGKFNKETGERLCFCESDSTVRYQDVFGCTLVELAEKNNKIIGITPAMPTGCSMIKMAERFPSRTFDVGIAEEHAVTFSGGLAKEGLLPYCNIYSSFMQRAFDEVIHDVATQNLHVVFCLDRAGLVGEDGMTHHGSLDLAYMRCIPNMTVSAPMNEHYLRHLMYTAQDENLGPFTIRYPRGSGCTKNWRCTPEKLEIGKGRKLCDGDDIAILSIGAIGNTAVKAAEMAKTAGVNTSVYDMIFLKPIDKEILHHVGKNFKRIVTVEDGCVTGGLGSAVAEFMAENGYRTTVKRVGIPDSFVTHGKPEELYKLCKMDADSIRDLLVSEW